MSTPQTDWEAVEQIGRRLYELSLPGVPVDQEELAALGSALVLMANVETDGKGESQMSAPEEMTEKEKAECQLKDFVQAVQSYDVRTSDFISYLMRNLKPGAIEGLAQDWDDSQERETE
jgi:hypothetical protein